MKMNCKIGVAFLMIVLMTGCSKKNNIDNERNKLLKEIDSLKQIIEKMDSRVMDLLVKQMVDDQGWTVDLKPTSTDFKMLKFNFGNLAAAIKDVQPYANGVKVSIRIGNPLAADLGGLSMKVDYGEVDENGSPVSKTEKSKEVSFIEPLNGGAWNYYDIILEGISPVKFGFIRLGQIGWETISLKKME
jgi:hypothetical protein